MKPHTENPAQTIIHSIEFGTGSVPEMLTKAFAGALKAALAEIERQRQNQTARSFDAFGDVYANGCQFRVTIECNPPKAEPGEFDALRFV